MYAIFMARTLTMFAFFAVCVAETTEDKNNTKTFEVLYDTAKRAYLDNDWKNCVEQMNLAVADFNLQRDEVYKCKKKCRRRGGGAGDEEDDVESVFDGGETDAEIDELRFFERLTRNTLCLMRCRQSAFSARTLEIDKEVLKDFENKVPYDYQQLCHYQLKEMQTAASCAFTNLVYNPDNKIMQDNLNFYLAQPGVKKEDVVNLEAAPHVAPFVDGTEHYRDSRWADVVRTMEAALESALESEERCRLECEKPFDMGWFPEFVGAVSNHFAFCLRCKRDCHEQTGNLNGELIEDIIPLIYHYLQIAYYSIGDLRKAAACAQSYLLFFPEDPEMLQNKEFYADQEGADEGWFVARLEAAVYARRDRYERNLVDFIEENFKFGEPKSTEEKRIELSAPSHQPNSLRGDDEVIINGPTPPPIAKLEL